MGKNTVEKIEKLIEPTIKEQEVELVDIEYTKEGQDWFLRIYIDTEDGIDLDKCSAVSEVISDVLDQSDPIEGAYFLEVSSPGAERPLKTKEDFENHLNENIYVSLYAPVNGVKQYEGTLLSFVDD